MEIWDAYNSRMEKIENKKLIRGEKIEDGLFHLVCEILVKHIDGTYLLMQRDLRKSFGGTWEATAGGSALAGENALQCAVRELREETGIVASELTEVGCIVDDKMRSIYVEYLCVTDWNKDSITLQEGETIAYKWVNRDQLLSMCDDELITYRVQKFIDELKH
ncbi:MAG: NUDIX hydrolase [Clostridiales bacterium]|nr:NUDIX hydrolase [Clostridiales bacterium]